MSQYIYIGNKEKYPKNDKSYKNIHFDVLRTTLHSTIQNGIQESTKIG